MRHATALLLLFALSGTGAAAALGQTLEVQLPPPPDVEETVKKTVKTVEDTAKKTVDDTVGTPEGGSTPLPSTSGSGSGGSSESGSGSGGSSAGATGGSDSGSASGSGSKSKSKSGSRSGAGSGSAGSGAVGGSAAAGLLVAGEHDKCPLDRRGEEAVLSSAGGGGAAAGRQSARGGVSGAEAAPALPNSDGGEGQGAFPGVTVDESRAGTLLTVLFFGIALGLAIVALAGGLASGFRRLRER